MMSVSVVFISLQILWKSPSSLSRLIPLTFWNMTLMVSGVAGSSVSPIGGFGRRACSGLDSSLSEM